MSGDKQQLILAPGFLQPLVQIVLNGVPDGVEPPMHGDDAVTILKGRETALVVQIPLPRTVGASEDDYTSRVHSLHQLLPLEPGQGDPLVSARSHPGLHCAGHHHNRSVTGRATIPLLDTVLLGAIPTLAEVGHGDGLVLPVLPQHAKPIHQCIPFFALGAGLRAAALRTADLGVVGLAELELLEHLVGHLVVPPREVTGQLIPPTLGEARPGQLVTVDPEDPTGGAPPLLDSPNPPMRRLTAQIHSALGCALSAALIGALAIHQHMPIVTLCAFPVVVALNTAGLEGVVTALGDADPVLQSVPPTALPALARSVTSAAAGQLLTVTGVDTLEPPILKRDGPEALLAGLANRPVALLAPAAGLGSIAVLGAAGPLVTQSESRRARQASVRISTDIALGLCGGAFRGANLALVRVGQVHALLAGLATRLRASGASVHDLSDGAAVLLHVTLQLTHRCGLLLTACKS
mmetsp:Transcript_39526/g.86240  ORF Transcript_39526/g.86240 Transcript_39526/m.86240 type:complete len:465 (+) Transcript_39526:697-2091(+)